MGHSVNPKEHQLHQIIDTLKEINQLLVHENNTALLIKKTCEILVQIRGYYFVWIGLFDKDNKMTQIESFGAASGIEKLEANANKGILPQLYSKALNTKEFGIYSTIQKDCPVQIDGDDWSSFVAPIHVNKETEGLMCAAIPNTYAQHPKEKQTFKDISNSIGSALGRISQQEELDKIQSEIKRSEAKYKNLINSLSDSVFISQDETIKYVNPALCEISGYSEHELLGSSFINIIENSELNNISEIHSEWLRTRNGKNNFQSIAKTKSGKIIQVEVTIIAIDFEGSPALQVILRDISEKLSRIRQLKKSEDNLLEKNKQLEKEKERALEAGERYQSLFSNNASVMLLIDTKNGEIIDANPAACSFYKYSYDEITSLNINQINTIPQDQLQQQMQIAIDEKRNHFSFKHRLADNSIKDVEVYSGAVTFARKKFLYSIVHDITSRKEAEEKLHASEQLLNMILQSMPAGFLVIDQNQCIKRVNQQTCDITGFSQDQLEGKCCKILCTNEDGCCSCPVWESEDETISGLDTFIMCSDGGQVPILKNAHTIVINGQKFILESFQNNTQQKKAEQRLLEAKSKAEESDKLKSAFLANMSHEIRTPMNGIIGFTELLKDPNLTGEQKEEFVDVIQKSGDKMLNTINDIIDISKIESGLVEVKLVEVDLFSFLVEIYLFFLAETNKKGIKLIFKNEAEPSRPTIQTDPEKLNSILTNLIKNAVKFTHQGSISFGYVLKDGTIEFDVEDTGIGIPANRHDAIFERFVQADIAGSRVFEGSGLGLSISKSYTEMLGGTIQMKSEEGKGTTFNVTLPFQKDQIKPQKVLFEIDNQQKHLQNNLKILIAEDDIVSIQLLEVFLRNISKELFIAKDGKEAIDIARNNDDIDLILMDIKMPKIDGLEAASKIREFNKDTKIIAQTAFAQHQDSQKAYEVGCNAFITKPINKKDLIQVIQSLFENK